MNPLVASIIRTLIPLLAGQLLALLAAVGLNLDTAGQGALTDWLGVTLAGVYYIIVRLVETKVPAVGWLLGLAKSPDSYSEAPALPVNAPAPAVPAPLEDTSETYVPRHSTE